MYFLISVHYPFRDRVIGEIPQVRAKIAHFARSLSQVSASFKQNKAMVRVNIKHGSLPFPISSSLVSAVT